MSWERVITAAGLGVIVPVGVTAVDVLGAERAGAAAAREVIVSVWPVATGESLSGWEVEQRGGLWWVVNDVEYAEYVHSQEQYGGPPGLADRTWPAMQAEAAATIGEQLAAIAAARADKAERGEARGFRGGARLVRPTRASAAPAPRTVIDPVTGTRAFQVPAAVVPAASVPVAGATSAGLVQVSGRAAAIAAESLLAPFIRSGAVDAVSLGLIRAGRLAEAERRLRSTGSVVAAGRLRDIIAQQQRQAAA